MFDKKRNGFWVSPVKIIEILLSKKNVKHQNEFSQKTCTSMLPNKSIDEKSKIIL